MADIGKDKAEAFITKWKGVAASELSTSQSFLSDLCRLLGVDVPHPTPEMNYMFERPITFRHGDGSESAGRIDLYRRGAFVLESKKLKAAAHTKGFDDALLRARTQAEAYARALPAGEGRPPFLVVVDVGNRIELYAEFTRSGATYTPFPDPRSHRIAIDDLGRREILERLRRIWIDPLSLDPSRESARVTREIAARLAELAHRLETSGHAPEVVAHFLMRCVFTMFAEDVKLLPADSFRDLLIRHKDTPGVAMRMLAELWRDMDAGGFSAAIATDVLRFNGKLFKTPDALPLEKAEVALLIEAARAKWEHVEPAIFGTLLERALEPAERHKLGGHYTPRAYVERLVLPTVIEPLRDEWNNARAAALVQLAEAREARDRGLEAEGRKSQAERLKQYNIGLRKARDILLDFHKRLCSVRVLDPACGSGNFLYVTLEHLKRLEGEVLNTLEDYGLSRLGITEQTGIDVHGERAISTEAQTVDPHNLLGIELNPRAAAIAEVVLWIGYLQWHFRTRGDVNPPIPVIRDFRNIENRDAVLAYDKVEYVTDDRGVRVTRWDGKTMKISPVTGEEVPDETARVPLERYVNPRKAAWPLADFAVGNPPFIGNKRMRLALGDGYVEALRESWDEVPESADFVMYWWHHAAQLTRRGALQRFGLITTNSIRQPFNRRVVEAALGDAKQPLSLVFAIPDHPWVDATDGAAVRIAMTVGVAGRVVGTLCEVVNEQAGVEETTVTLRENRGTIFSNLRVGANVGNAKPLKANRGLCWQGCKLVGASFQIDVTKRAELLRTGVPHERLPRYTSGSDLMKNREVRFVIDTYGLEEQELKQSFPAAYQHLHDYVLPERAHNADHGFRTRWWLMGRPRPELRAALCGLYRYAVTSEVAKHRVFTMLSWPDDLIDGSVIAVASEDYRDLGIVSSVVSQAWILAAGGTLEDRPRYHTETCFDPLPFPAEDEQAARIRSLAEQLDTLRKRQQSIHSDLTLTGMYNVLEKLRSDEVLTAKERLIHAQGLLSVLRQLHDDLDSAVLDAYGWSDLMPLLRVAHGNHAPAERQSRDDIKRAFNETILNRLVGLNAERSAEEARSLVRWLRPEFQNPKAQFAPEQIVIDTGNADDEGEIGSGVAVAKPLPWPKDTIEQVRAVASLLESSPAPLSVDQIGERFTARGPWKKRLPQLLEMLVALGRAREHAGAYAGVN